MIIYSQERYKMSQRIGVYSSLFIFLIATLDFSGAGCPKKCKCFRAGTSTDDWIKCDKGGLMTFPRPISRSRDIVYIRNNDITEVPSNPFGTSTSTDLTYIFLDNNHIDTIADRAFANPKYLRTLSLVHNALFEIQLGYFSGLHNLKQLYLDGNVINELKADIFKDMWRLHILSLADNNINNVERYTFSGLAELQEVYLNNNSINVLRSGVFSGFRDIKKIALQHNYIHTINHVAFSSLYHLEELILSQNGIQQIRAEWFNDLSALRTLDFSKNRIIQIVNRAFALLTNLHSLDLSDNFIIVMGNAKMEGLNNLASLNFENNQGVNIRNGAFYQLENLETLNLGNTSHTIGIDMFQNVENTTQLNRLTTLKLSNLTSFPIELLAITPNVEVLVIGDSDISLLRSNSFENNTVLKEIYLSNTGIRSIEPNTLKTLKKLRKFQISNNNLVSLPVNLFTNIHRNIVVCLPDNPWHCDCSMQWLTQWMKRRGRRWCKNSRPICQTPSNKIGDLLWNVDYEQC